MGAVWSVQCGMDSTLTLSFFYSGGHKTLQIHGKSNNDESILQEHSSDTETADSMSGADSDSTIPYGD